MHHALGEIDEGNPMIVGNFRGGEWKSRTRIPHSTTIQGLWPVQVAQCDIRKFGRKHIWRHRMFPTNQDAPLGPFGGKTARASQMPHCQKRQTTGTLNRSLGHLAMQGPHSGRNGGFITILGAKMQARQIGLSQEGHRQNMRA